MFYNFVFIYIFVYLHVRCIYVFTYYFCFFYASRHAPVYFITNDFSFLFIYGTYSRAYCCWLQSVTSTSIIIYVFLFLYFFLCVVYVEKAYLFFLLSLFRLGFYVISRSVVKILIFVNWSDCSLRNIRHEQLLHFNQPLEFHYLA